LPFFSIPQTNDHATVFNFYLKQALKFTSMIPASPTLQQRARSAARRAARKNPGKKTLKLLFIAQNTTLQWFSIDLLKIFLVKQDRCSNARDRAQGQRAKKLGK